MKTQRHTGLALALAVMIASGIAFGPLAAGDPADTSDIAIDDPGFDAGNLVAPTDRYGWERYLAILAYWHGYFDNYRG